MTVDERLRRLFSDVFGVDAASVAEDDSPESIEAWDSVAHLNLVFALEGEFEVQLEAEEIPELVSFRAIRDRLQGAGGPTA